MLKGFPSYFRTWNNLLLLLMLSPPLNHLFAPISLPPDHLLAPPNSFRKLSHLYTKHTAITRSTIAEWRRIMRKCDFGGCVGVHIFGKVKWGWCTVWWCREKYPCECNLDQFSVLGLNFSLPTTIVCFFMHFFFLPASHLDEITILFSNLIHSLCPTKKNSIQIFF